MVHAFSSARESFLVLIDPILGRKGGAWTDIFMRLQGKLFARLQLDSFEDELDALFDALGDQMPTTLQWTYIAITCISSLYQYGRKDSRLREALRQGRREKREAEVEEPLQTEEPGDGDAILPSSPVNDHVRPERPNIEALPQKFYNIPFEIRSQDQDDIPVAKIVFDKACHLSFSLLSESLNIGTEVEIQTFVHIWLAFFSYVLRYPPVVQLFERKVPWQELADWINDIASNLVCTGWTCDPHQLAELEMDKRMLPEDVHMQGFDWSRKLFPKDWFENIDILEGLPETEKTEVARMKRLILLGVQITKVLLKICRCLM